MALTKSTLGDFFAYSPEMLFIAMSGGTLLQMSRALEQAIGSVRR